MANGYTEAGLKAIAAIVRQARGQMTYREFEAEIAARLAESGLIGTVPHGTIRRIELCAFALGGRGPETDTLLKISYVTPYTFEELQAIGTERSPDYVRSYRVAEDVLPAARELPRVQKLRLIQMLTGEMVLEEKG